MRRHSKKLFHLLCNLLGVLLFAIGFIGIFLPLLPTTIFWIIAAFLFARANPAWQQKIYQWPVVGHTVEDFVERGIIKTRSKYIAILGVAGVGSLSLYLSGPAETVLYGVAGVLLLVILFIFTRQEK